MSKHVRRVAIILLVVASIMSLSGCRAARMATRNLQIGADNFEIYRRVTVINLRSDKKLLEVEGYVSLQDTASSEIGIVIKTAPNEYKMHYVYTTNDCVYIVEQLENTHADPYHWRIVIFAITPDVDIG